MDCYHCGHTLIWDSDFESDDPKEKESVLITTFRCPYCPTTVEIKHHASGPVYDSIKKTMSHISNFFVDPYELSDKVFVPPSE
jgi:hypothetical protein